MGRRTRVLSTVAASVVALSLIAGCGQDNSESGGNGAPGKLTLAPQFGLAYLPHVVMMESEFLQKRLPGTTIEEVQLSGGGAVVEQLISGSIDVGYMGIGPFLKAVDGGANLKAISCLEEMPLELMTTKKEAKSIADLGPNDRIALPGPSSHQAYTLKVAAMKQLGDPKAFDTRMIGLPHPDAMSALLGGQEVTAHFAQPPFIGQEKAANAKSILNSHDVFGDHCLIVAVARSDFDERNPEARRGLLEGLKEAVEFITSNPEGAADMLAAKGDKTPKDQLLNDIRSESTVWTTDIRGLQRTADLLKEAGVLQKDHRASDLVFDGVEVS